MTSDTADALSAWQQRCKTQGLALTTSRNAILRALLEQREACDAVPLLQAAQQHHAATSIGTVYRFLRELELRGLVDALTQARRRTRWRLRSDALFHAAQVAHDIHQVMAQVQGLLHTLEQMGLAEHDATPVAAASSTQPDDHRTLAVLHDIAAQLGYRLLPQRRQLA